MAAKPAKPRDQPIALARPVPLPFLLAERICRDFVETLPTPGIERHLPPQRALAQHYGVSRRTVATAFMRLENDGIIAKRARALAEVADAPVPAEAVRTGGPTAVGFIARSVDGVYSNRLLSVCQHALARHGIPMTYVSTRGLPGAEEVAVTDLLRTGVSAFIVVPCPGCGTTPGFYTSLFRGGTTVVFLDRYVDGETVPWVASDNFTGGYTLARHLLQRGLTRFWYVLPGEYPVTSVRDRVAGVRAALGSAGLPVDALELHRLVDEGTKGTSASLRPLVGRLRRGLQGSGPTIAVMCAHDYIARECVQQCAEAGIRMPEQVVVTGFDGLPFATCNAPPFTTVTQYVDRLAREAVALLLRCMGQANGASNVLVPVELVPAIGEAVVPEAPAAIRG